MGYETEATGNYSTAIGYQNYATGEFSLAGGRWTVAQGKNSLAFSEGGGSIGDFSFSLGYVANAIGKYSVAIGEMAAAQAYLSMAFGRHNVSTGNPDEWIATDPLFVLGNGTAWNAQSNAFTVLKNGNVGVGISAPTQKLQVSGNATVSGTVSASEFQGSVNGNVTGKINQLTLGKVNLTSSGTIVSINGGEFILYWDSVGNEIMIVNSSGNECHVWWQGQQGLTPLSLRV